MKTLERAGPGVSASIAAQAKMSQTPSEALIYTAVCLPALTGD